MSETWPCMLKEEENSHLSEDYSSDSKNLISDINSQTKRKLGIVGCRKFSNYPLMKKYVQEVEQKKGIFPVIVSGGASGADNLAETYAKEFNREMIVFPALWGKYGRKAGPLRNIQIVDECDVLVAFPSSTSKGTWDSVTKAKSSKKEVIIFNI